MDVNRAVFRESLAKLAFSVRNEARTLLNRLDRNLNPEVTVIAVPFKPDCDYLVVDADDYHHGGLDWFSNDVFLKPTGYRYKAEWFEPVHNIVTDIPDNYLSDLAPDVQGVIWDDKVQVKTSVQHILDLHHKEIGGLAFTTFPEFVFGYSVSVILQLSESAIKSHNTLRKNTRWGLPETSLIYETVIAFLYSVSDVLDKLSSGNSWYRLSEKGDEILRSAGYWLTAVLEDACETEEEDDSHRENLFRPCNVISSLFYEGNEGLGRILVSKRGHPNVVTIVEFNRPLKMSNYRGIRKLLEVASVNLNLLCDSSTIYGLGALSDHDYDASDESLFVIEFTSHHTWNLVHAGKQLMTVSYNLPGLPATTISENEFRKQALEVFSQITDIELRRLWALVREALRQKHGTILVVSSDADAESIRLRFQSTAVKPVQLDPNLLLPLTSIDGAVLLDTGAICYAIGTILDGVASENGNPARGARYNSAIRYRDHMQARNKACLIVVISEDGMAEILSSHKT